MRAFSLIEILIVMLLIGIGLSMGGIQISKALSNERFERAIDALAARLEMAQNLMLDMRMDISVTWEKRAEGVLCKITPLRPISRELEKMVSLHQLIKGVDEIAYERVPFQELFYEANLGLTPRGEVLIRKGDKSALLLLRGYPSKIRRKDHDLEKMQEASYPEEILSLI